MRCCWLLGTLCRSECMEVVTVRGHVMIELVDLKIDV